MQISDSKKQLAGSWDFRITRGRFRAERKPWKDAFLIRHHGRFEVHNFPNPTLQSGFVRDNRAVRFRKSFFSAKSITQLVAEQGVTPIKDIGVLAGAIPDDDLDEFVSDIYRMRKG